MTITPEQIREHLDAHLHRIAVQAAREELRRRLAVRAFPRAAYHDLFKECRQYLVVWLLRPSTLAAMAASYCEEIGDGSEGVPRLAYGWARNGCRRFLREEVYCHHRPRVFTNCETSEMFLETAVSKDDPVDAEVLKREVRERVRLAVAALAEEDVRQAVVLVLLEGHSYKEAAEKMGVEFEYLKHQLAKGRRLLREMLGGL